MINFKSYLKLIEEGGAAGHMAHPFDLPSVRTGKDLINLFDQVKASVSVTPAVVKIDGVNCSIKLITNDDGSMEFALDRGSNNPLDVRGVTINKLRDRFPEGHGFIPIGETVLNIFNRALLIPTVINDLKKLNFLKNKNLLFNMEYVEGSTNVVNYPENFLAIHGINEIYEHKSAVRQSISRKTREVERINRGVLEDFILKINQIADGFNFKVYSSIEATVKTEINYIPVLNAGLTIHYTTDHYVKKSLKHWLESCSNPVGVKLKTITGKPVDAVSKKLYLDIINGTPVSDLVENGNDEKNNLAVCGAVIYHATRLLGNAVLDALTSSIGDLGTQEGIVIRDSRISTIPFKITGEFIVRGMTSPFRKEDDEELEVEGGTNDSMLPPYDNTYTGRQIPGGGKSLANADYGSDGNMINKGDFGGR